MSFSPDIREKFKEYNEARQTFLTQIHQQDYSKKTDPQTLKKTKEAFAKSKENLEKTLPNEISIKDLERQNTTWITSSETKKPTIRASRILGRRDAVRFKTAPTFEAHESL